MSKNIESMFIGLSCTVAICMGLTVGYAYVTHVITRKLEVRIEQIHTHTCRLEAKLDYPTTPDCPVAPEDDR